ncbi:MAG: hypothetical protein QOJ35_2671 [Solirubrobacteraceae bacterium]|nr:hypothetical protein [Solirubrobacteraceae bacterium]
MARCTAALSAALAAFVLLSCGGADKAAKTKTAADGGAQARQADRLVAQSLKPNATARSGVIDAETEITIKGVKGFSEPFTASVSGPFSYRRGAALPDYELELGVRGYGVTLTSVHGRSYVSIGDTGYALPAPIRQRLVRSSSKGRNGLTRTLEQFGISPPRWETERRVVGTETLDGVEVTRIATSFNAGRILRDANTLLGLMASLGITRAVGLPATISQRARRAFVRGVTSKVAATWVGTKDKVTRRSGFTMRFTIPRAQRRTLSGISGGMVVATLMVTEAGKAQTISPPTKTGSFANFKLALDALGAAQDAKGG